MTSPPPGTALAETPSPRNDREEPAPAPPAPRTSPLAPFGDPVFRMLWTVWFAANIATWMNDVAAAWVMTSLTTKPLWVALVQTAATLPVFLFGLASGALADSIDRKRYLLFTQGWVAVVALLTCALLLAGQMSPPLLLVLMFANGVGLAMRWPVYSAIIPEVVPRAQLPSAMALNGVSANASRIVGPLLAGAIIAAAGSAWVFVLNAVLAVVSITFLARWPRVHRPSPLGREPLLSGMRVGLQFVAQSARLKAVLVRIALYFFHSAALLALLPLEARRLGGEGGGAGTYTLLLASMGAGAIASAAFLPRLRRVFSRDALVLAGTVVQALATVCVAFAPHAGVAAPAMFAAGVAWLSTVNSLGVSAQLALPDWVRARGMSVYQMAVMGGSALGAALWGQVATMTSLTTSLAIAAASGVLTMVAGALLVVDRKIEEDLSRSSVLKAPDAEAPAVDGRIVVDIEFHIDPARAGEFRVLMQESRRSRLRQGALDWDLLSDVHDPGRFVERIVDENWTEHLRRFDRVTAADITLRERKLAFHQGESPPRISRWVSDPSARG
ncbi:MAG: MFS transporter [Burkholderiales bacterium]|nr:MFS transporter [Burkholderiales bacterium]